VADILHAGTDVDCDGNIGLPSGAHPQDHHGGRHRRAAGHAVQGLAVGGEVIFTPLFFCTIENHQWNIQGRARMNLVPLGLAMYIKVRVRLGHFDPAGQYIFAHA
jgi:hypothetical protein